MAASGWRPLKTPAVCFLAQDAGTKHGNDATASCEFVYAVDIVEEREARIRSCAMSLGLRLFLTIPPPQSFFSCFSRELTERSRARSVLIIVLFHRYLVSLIEWLPPHVPDASLIKAQIRLSISIAGQKKMPTWLHHLFPLPASSSYLAQLIGHHRPSLTLSTRVVDCSGLLGSAMQGFARRREACCMPKQPPMRKSSISTPFRAPWLAATLHFRCWGWTTKCAI